MSQESNHFRSVTGAELEAVDGGVIAVVAVSAALLVWGAVVGSCWDLPLSGRRRMRRKLWEWNISIG
jgi:hypothetical protein